MKKIICLFTIFYLLAVLACKEEQQERDFPEVITSALQVIEEGVILTSTVNIGSERIIDHGVIFAPTDPYPPSSGFDKISLGPFPEGTSFSVNIDKNLEKDKRYSAKAYLQTESYLVYGNLVFFTSNGSKSHEIKDYFPKTAFTSDTITIRGIRFSSNKEDISIWLGQTKANPCSASDTLLKVVIPELSETTNLQIKVEMISTIITAKESFNLKPPYISNMTPTKGLPLETIKISGKGLLSVSKIIIDNSEQVLVTKTDSTLIFNISKYLNKGEKLIQLFQIDRNITINEKLMVLYPEITDISPITVWNDTILSVSGTNLNHLNSFFLDSYNSTVEMISITDTLIKLKVLQITGDSYLSAQTNFNNETITSSQKVLFNRPIITSISGTAIYGETITLHGDRFFSGIECALGEYQYINKNEAKLTINWNLGSGTHPISLSYLGVHLVNTFSLTIPRIEIIDVSPYEVKSGTKITINTRNLPQTNLTNPVMCYLDNTYFDFQNDNGVLTATMPEYIDCNEYPVLTIHVGNQIIRASDKFHVTHEWVRVYPVDYFSETTIFIENEGNLYSFFNDYYYLRYTKFHSFDPITEKWILFDDNRAPLISSVITHFCIGKDIYFIAAPNELYRYSLLNLTWERMNQLPWDFFTGYIFTINGKVYMGNEGSLYMYNPENDIWTLKKNPPVSDYILSFSTDTKGYLGVSNSLVEYDPNNDLWEDTRQIIDLKSYRFARFSNGKVYFLGDNFGEFNPATYEIREIKKPLIYSDPIIFFANNFVYLISSGYNYHYEVQMFKIAITDLPKIYK